MKQCSPMQRSMKQRSMKQGSTLRRGVSPNSTLVVIVLTAFAALLTGWAGCQGPTDRQAEALKRVQAFQHAEALKQAQAPSGNSAAFVPVCPGYLAVAPTPQAKSGHRVILSWKASAPADSRHTAAAGYCVYRGTKHKDSSPQLLNSAPLAGTSCVDDLLVNDQKYYYVVRAISLQGSTSDTSNEAPAVIPAGSQSSTSPSSAPLCR